VNFSPTRHTFVCIGHTVHCTSDEFEEHLKWCPACSIMMAWPTVESDIASTESTEEIRSGEIRKAAALGFIGREAELKVEKEKGSNLQKEDRELTSRIEALKIGSRITSSGTAYYDTTKGFLEYTPTAAGSYNFPTEGKAVRGSRRGFNCSVHYLTRLLLRVILWWKRTVRWL
jgi:hypothetical protein